MPIHKYIWLLLLSLLLAAAPAMAQQFNNLFDVDSTYEWGWNIQLLHDGTYFVNGWNLNQTTNEYGVLNVKISHDGQHLLDKHILHSTVAIFSAGDPGKLFTMSDGNFIAPLSLSRPHASVASSEGGWISFSPTGDTIATRVFTDTSIYRDIMRCGAIRVNGGFLSGGSHSQYEPVKYPGIIMCMKTNGDTLWTHIYQKHSNQSATIRTLIPLEDGRILACGSSNYVYGVSGFDYSHDTPWFMILDSMGNIQKDTLYGNKYTGGGFIYKDTTGGYVTFGAIDTIVNIHYPEDPHNFPYYIAKLDTNFHMQWITRFDSWECNDHRSPCQIKQLHDGNYVILGDDYCNGCLCAPAITGWAAKINRETGAIIWNQNYWTHDTDQWSYLRDMVELPNGNLIFTGTTHNDTMALWRQGNDLWLFGTDSNGCVIPGCNIITGITNEDARTAVPVIYPNPGTGPCIFSSPAAGRLAITNIAGATIATHTIAPGDNRLTLPAGSPPGIYLFRFVANDAQIPPFTAKWDYEP